MEMSENFTREISKYINEIESRGVIDAQTDTSNEYIIFYVLPAYTMQYGEDKIHSIVYHVDGNLEFSNENNVDILIIDDALDLPLLSNIKITLDLSLVENLVHEVEEDPVDNNGLKSIEKQLDRLTQLTIKTAERLDKLEQKLLKFNQLEEAITDIKQQLENRVQHEIKSNHSLTQ
jgi:hypothetical protein